MITTEQMKAAGDTITEIINANGGNGRGAPMIEALCAELGLDDAVMANAAVVAGVAFTNEVGEGSREALAGQSWFEGFLLGLVCGRQEQAP